MKIRITTIAAVLALSSTMALAQAGGNGGGATVPERSGAGISGPGPGGPSVGTTDSHGRNEPVTSGMSQSSPGAEPGARDRSRTGGEGVNDRPPGN
jgi:hypothetical protein